MKKGFYWIILLMVVGSACTSNDPAASKTQLLTQNSWLFSFGDSTDPAIQSLLPLLNGSVYIFYTNHTYNLTVRAVPSVSNPWEFSSDETKLILQKGTADERTINIILLNATEFHFQEVTGTIKTDYYYVKRA